MSTPTELSGVTVVETTSIVDSRGAFARLFCERELATIIGNRRIVQVNHSRSDTVGTIRGLHYQRLPHSEMKLVRCLRGRVWDVAVDLRAASPTFLLWHAEELSAGNARMLVIPEGCAHGFQVLEPGSELLYLHTAPYTSESEAGVAWNDPRIGIAWPLPPAALSPRDDDLPPLPADFPGLDV